MKNLISIITASYNYENYIKETIESVLNQTYQNWELIIVDDGSKDNSVNVIKSYCEKDSRIKLFQHEGGINKGLAETIKLGVSKANGEWIAFLESDDKFMPECLEEKIKVAEKNPEIGFIFSDLETFGEVNTKIDKNYLYEAMKQKYKKTCIDMSIDLLKQNWISTFSIVMLKKSLLDNCNYDTPIQAFLDRWIWIQVSQKTKFYYLDKKLTMWRIHSKSFLNNFKCDMNKFDIEIEQFYKNNKKAKFAILMRKFKRFKKRFISIKLGKNAEISILGKTLYKI